MHGISVYDLVIRHLLQGQLLLRWYLRQQRVRVRVMIGALVQGRVRIKIRIRVGVMFNVRVYHWSNCRRSKLCRTFLHDLNQQENRSSIIIGVRIVESESKMTLEFCWNMLANSLLQSFRAALLNLFELEAHFKCGNFFGAHHWKQENDNKTGADPGFSFRVGGGGGGGGGGGVQKIMCQHAHYERGTELTFGRGQGPAKGPWKLWGCFNAVSYILSLIFKHSDKNLDYTKTQSIHFFFGGGGGGGGGAPVAPPPPQIRHWWNK